MIRIRSLLIIALLALGFNAGIVSAGPIYTLNSDYIVNDAGAYGAGSYAVGRISGTAVSPLLFDLVNNTQISVNVPQYDLGGGIFRSAVNASITSVDWSTGIASVGISYGAGVGNRTGTVSLIGGTVILDQFATTTGASTTAVNAAAGGYQFGGTQGQAAFAQPGGFWTTLTTIGGNILDAVSTALGVTAVGHVSNTSGGADGAVFTGTTSFTLSVQHGCGSSFCSVAAVSSDGLWGGLAFDNQVGLLDLATNTRYLLPGDAQVRGVLGGANPVLFYQSATGPRAYTLGGADLDFASWYQLVNGTPLGFVPTGVGDARVSSGQVIQLVTGSVNIVNYTDPNQGGENTVPEPGSLLLMAAGLLFIATYLQKRSRARHA